MITLKPTSLEIDNGSADWSATIIAPSFSDEAWNSFQKSLNDLGLLAVGCKILDDGIHFAAEIYLNGYLADITTAQNQLKDTADQLSIDFCLQEFSANPKGYKIAIFDMDSTLIQCEVIDELAKRAGIGEQVAAITASAMRGEIDFKESFAQRLGLIEGLSEEVLESIAATLPLTPGVEYLIKALRALGLKTAVFSGGFQYFAEHLKKHLKLDYAHANTLEIIDGKVTGKAHGTIVDAEHKEVLLRQKAQENNAPLYKCICVGDGANDLKMIGSAGLGVAFHAKPLVRREAPYAISSVGLDGLLYLMGYSRKECDEAIAKLND